MVICRLIDLVLVGSKTKGLAVMQALGYFVVGDANTDNALILINGFEDY